VGNTKNAAGACAQSTYCKTVQEYAASTGRSVHVVNLDPAAEQFEYDVAFDVRELISADDVMEELGYGPNGGLVYCMEYMTESLDWLRQRLSEYGDDDYLLFDCPGQVELYSHIPVMRRVVELLREEDFQMCGVYLIDAAYATDAAKLLSGSLAALSAMVHLEIPHRNVLSKCDLVAREHWERFLEPCGEALVEEMSESLGPKFLRLSHALGAVLDEFSLVNFVPLDPSDEDSVAYVLAHIDRQLQYGEDMEPREPTLDDGAPSHLPDDDE
jgi:GPN-loop GTPase